MKKAVIAISSHVARGSVGNRAAVFALEFLGHRVWSVPTIILPYHPGHGAGTRIVPDVADFAALLDDLAKSDWIGEVGAVLTGYMADAGQALAVGRFIAGLRERNPGILHFCDPVMGDHGRLYVAPATAAAIRDALVPDCDILSPNRFELSWLTGLATESIAEALAATLAYPEKSVLVTSITDNAASRIGNLFRHAGRALHAEHDLIANPPNGPGDLTSALLLSGLLSGHDASRALLDTTARVHRVIQRSVKAGIGELDLSAGFTDAPLPSDQISLVELPLPALPEAVPG